MRIIAILCGLLSWTILTGGAPVRAEDSARIATPAIMLAPPDEAVAREARERALEAMPSRKALSWRGTRGETHGSVTPLRTYLARNGMFCREFEQTTVSPTMTLTETRLACRDSVGTWRLVP